jgi:hypothetical protein
MRTPVAVKAVGVSPQPGRAREGGRGVG